MSMYGYVCLPRAMYPCMSLYGFVGLRMAMCGYVGLCRAVNSYVGLCRAMYGYVGWLYRAVYCYARLCMAM